MHISMTKYALAGCATLMVGGCATPEVAAPQYRLTTPSAQMAEGTSMLQRGRAQLDAGLDALAIESFRAEIRFNPGSVDAYNGLAVAYGRIGRNDLAQRYFEIALAKDPLNVKVQANLAKLPGNEGLSIQQAASWPTPAPLEPVAVTAEAGSSVDEAMVVDQQLPALAVAQLQPTRQPEAQPLEILEKRGVLSSRFAVAAAATTISKARSNVVMRSVAPAQPVRLPVRPSERPTPYLQPEIRVGARLERVSLNEVRLITLATHPASRRQPTPSFDSFGDRIALWLPAYMSAEQAASRYRGDENIVIMAALERAGAKTKVATATKAQEAQIVAAPEFAYIVFDDSDGVAGT